MEPTIYKPSIYKGTGGLYKGAGGLYKGRGVYNDGETLPGFFYVFNLSRFNLVTLKDGDVQWNCTHPSYLSKESDYLAINLASQPFEFCFRPYIDKTKKIICEFTITLPTLDFFYVGFSADTCNFALYSIGSNNWFINSALVGSIKNYNIYNGGIYNTSWTNNARFSSFPYAQKQKIKLEINPDGHGKFYIDDILSLEGDYSYDYDFFLNNFNFKVIAQALGVIKLFSLKMWQE